MNGGSRETIIQRFETTLVQMRECSRYTPEDVDELESAAWDVFPLLKAQDAGWISADNRPPSQGRYLVYGLTKFVPDHIDQPNAYWEVKTAYWSNGFGWDCKVKYWMPLPEPPKEG